MWYPTIARSVPRSTHCALRHLSVAHAHRQPQPLPHLVLRSREKQCPLCRGRIRYVQRGDDAEILRVRHDALMHISRRRALNRYDEAGAGAGTGQRQGQCGAEEEGE